MPKVIQTNEDRNLPKMIQTNEPVASGGEETERRAEHAAEQGAAQLRREMAGTMDAARKASTAAAETVDRATDRNVVKVQTGLWNLVVRTMTEQASRNGSLLLDISGLHGWQRAFSGHHLYWQDTMSGMQRFQDQWRVLSQDAAAQRRLAD